MDYRIDSAVLARMLEDFGLFDDITDDGFVASAEQAGVTRVDAASSGHRWKPVVTLNAYAMVDDEWRYVDSIATIGDKHLDQWMKDTVSVLSSTATRLSRLHRLRRMVDKELGHAIPTPVGANAIVPGKASVINATLINHDRVILRRGAKHDVLAWDETDIRDGLRRITNM